MRPATFQHARTARVARSFAAAGFAAASLAAAPLWLGGCRVGPDAAEVDLAPQLAESWRHVATTAAEPTTAEDLATWWESMEDPTLTRLIRQALSSSLTLEAARERIVAARARRGIENAAALPALSAEAGYSFVQSGDDAISFNGAPAGVETDLYSLGVVAGWELDLWGRVARLVESADAEIALATEDLRALRVSLAAAVAREVFTVRSLDAEIAALEAGIATDRDVLAIAEARERAGFRDSLDAARARRVLAADLAERPALDGAREASLLRLAALLGQAPGTVKVPSIGGGALLRTEFFGLAAPLPRAGVPANLLRRRPDVRRAIAEVDGATARIGAAEAQRYPRVTLGGSLALQGPDASDALNFDARVVQFGPRIVLPLFEGGRILAGIEEARAQQREAVFQLRQAVVDAQAEVETAAVGVARADDRVLRLAEARAAALDTERLARDRHAAGASDFLSVTEAVTARLAIVRQEVLAQREALIRRADLYAALGGGW